MSESKRADVLGDLFNRFEAAEEAREDNEAKLPQISPETAKRLLANIEADLDEHYPKNK